MWKKVVNLIGVLVLVLFVFKLISRLADVEYRNVKLMLQLERINKSYVNTSSELNKVLDELFEKTTSPHIQDVRTFRDKSISVLNRIVNYTTPGSNHPFMLIGDISIDKFRIIPDRRRNDYKFVYGIPTVARPQKQRYLLETLDSLFKDPVSLQQVNCLIVILVGDLDSDKCTTVTDMVRRNHGKFIDGGLLEILCPHSSLYPSLETVRRTLGDRDDRFMWRSKQNLDYAFLMWYASNKGEYYVQLEDDIVAAGSYAYHINDYVDRVKDDLWFLIHFSRLGFIGKLFRGNDLLSFTQYLLLFYTNQPCDWLLHEYGRDLICYTEQDEEGCHSLLYSITSVYTPSLFQHMGTVSSLGGKVQNLKDPSFKDDPSVHKDPKYSNPGARIKTTFSIYQQNTARLVYDGEGVLWSDKVLAGNNVLVEFFKVEELKGIKITSGNEDHPTDLLQHGVVQFKRSRDDDFEYWGEFKDGKVDIRNTESRSVHSIRVSATEEQDYWLLISHFECLR